MTARKSLTIVAVGALIAFALGELAIRWVQDQVNNMAVAQVVDSARGSVEVGPARVVIQKADGLGFPNLAKQKLELVGGNSDTLLAPKRTVTTAVYREGKRRLTYSIVSGTAPVKSPNALREISLNTARGKVPAQELNDLPGVADSDFVALKYKRAGRTVLLTASPRDDAARRKLRAIAKLDGDAVSPKPVAATSP